MKKTLLTVVCALFALGLSAQQWNQLGDYKIKGKVGIGVLAPKTKLDVEGGMAITRSQPQPDGLVGSFSFYNRYSSRLPVASIGIKNNPEGVDSHDYSNIVFSTWYRTAENNDITGKEGPTEKMRITAKGNVGIGTSTPRAKLDVSGKVFITSSKQNNDELIGELGFCNSYTSNFAVASISARTRLTGSGACDYSNIVFSTWNGYNTLSEKMRISSNGNVGIGTTDPGSYKLAVKGKVGCGELVVTDVSKWADFVFDSNYDLMSLSELDAFIKENKHLPEIPTTKEVSENGVSVGEMNAKLLQKIEELTLYVIELKKENDKIKEYIRNKK